MLVPNVHAGQAFIRALAQAQGQAVLLPPKVITLPAWVDTVSLDEPMLPDSRRTLLLYQSLRQHDWFDADSLWAMSVELGRLFDELTERALSLPEQIEDFSQQLATAYGTHAQSAIAFEARLVHELWYALAVNPTEGMPAAAIYAMKLAHLLRYPPAPLCVLYLPDFDDQEQLFVTEYAKAQTVISLWQPTQNIAAQILSVAWTDPAHASMRERALQLAQTIDSSPWHNSLQITPTDSLESQAHAAAAQIHLWGAENDCTHIAVVVQDRLVARRLRALLERDQIWVSDETGWTLDTTMASTAVMRWVETVQADFPYWDVLDLLQAQLCCADWPAVDREQAVSMLQRYLRQHGPVSGWSNWLSVVKSHASDTPLYRVLLRMYHAAEGLLTPRQRTVSEWLDALEASLQQLGADAYWRSDQAGEQIWTLLQQRQHELRGTHLVLTLPEFSRWLDHTLQTAQFVDRQMDSPLIFTHLAATRCRPFDAVLILGADATQWAPSGISTVFFNQAVRHTLGLRTQSKAIQQWAEDTALLLNSVKRVRILWQAQRADEANPLAPAFARLDMLHRLAWHINLYDESLLAWRRPEVKFPTVQMEMPAPIPWRDLIPTQISASGYRSLMTCPYQYYARYLLGLKSADEIRGEMVKADYGQLVHAVLYEFHQSYPRVCDVGKAQAEQTLSDISQRLFASNTEQDFYTYGWQARWMDKIPEYVSWQLAREAEGWFWDHGELDVQYECALDNSRVITLQGRIDRIDRRADACAVLDYKTGGTNQLKANAKVADESVQLAVYALLSSQNKHLAVTQAAYLSMDDARIQLIELDTELPTVMDCMTERLSEVFNGLYAGFAMPANAEISSCARCEVKGLCRRDYWQSS